MIQTYESGCYWGPVRFRVIGDSSNCFLYYRIRKDWHEELQTTISLGVSGVVAIEG